MWPIQPWTWILTTGKLHQSLGFHPSTCQQLLPKVRNLKTTTSRLCDLPEVRGRDLRSEQAGALTEKGRENRLERQKSG